MATQLANDVTEVREAIKAFAPPPAEVGMTVLWFDNAKRNNTPEAAYVVRVIDGRHLELFMPHTGQRRRRVRHVDDPEHMRLQNQTMKQGGWDHTDFNKKVLARLEAATPSQPKKG